MVALTVLTVNVREGVRPTKKKIEGADYFVTVRPFPNYAAHGLCTTNPDCTDSVLINANLPVEMWGKVLEHEVGHLERDDLYRDGPVPEKEK